MTRITWRGVGVGGSCATARPRRAALAPESDGGHWRRRRRGRSPVRRRGSRVGAGAAANGPAGRLRQRGAFSQNNARRVAARQRLGAAERGGFHPALSAFHRSRRSFCSVRSLLIDAPIERHLNEQQSGR